MRIRPRIAGLASVGAATAAIEGLIRADLVQLREAEAAGDPFPPIYLSGVRYQRTDPREEWRTVPVVLEKSGGDCEDLAAWRAAELRAQGVRAVVRLRKTGRRRYHAVVCIRSRRSGRILCEDPSRILAKAPRLRRARGVAEVRFPRGKRVRATGPDATPRALEAASKVAAADGYGIWAKRLGLAARVVATGYAPWAAPLFSMMDDIRRQEGRPKRRPSPSVERSMRDARIQHKRRSRRPRHRDTIDIERIKRDPSITPIIPWT